MPSNKKCAENVVEIGWPFKERNRESLTEISIVFSVNGMLRSFLMEDNELGKP